MLYIVTMAVRGLQLLFAIIILVLSASLARQQVYEKVPATTGYSSFTGGFGFLVAVVGLASYYFEVMPLLVTMVLDGLTALFSLCGGIAWAIGLGSVSCTSTPDTACAALYANSLVNEGCRPTDAGLPYCGVYVGRNEYADVCRALQANCYKARAAEYLHFVALAALAGLLALGYLPVRRGGGARRFKTNVVVA